MTLAKKRLVCGPLFYYENLSIYDREFYKYRKIKSTKGT